MMDLNMAEPGEILPDRKIDTSAYDLLQTTRTSVEDIVAQMLSIKKGGGGDSTKSKLPELVTQMLLNFVNLRKANRSILLEEDLVKAETEHAKAPVDFTTLQLHNLMYEKNHYVKAIKACKDFKSKYPDIELVPEEEFLRDAPEEIKSCVESNESAHDLMLKRLNFELFQRKELWKLHQKLEEQKKILEDTIGNRKKFLSSLPSHLKSLKKASLPVQNQLGILHTKKLKQHESAELLPPPLYVIYSQLLAHKEAFGESIDVEITGSIKDAHTFARHQANKDNGNIESSKLEDVDEEDDGQRRRKRPKVKETLVDPARIYQTHPLKLTLQIHDDVPKPTKLIVLKFEYLVRLNVVCVGVEGSNESNMLCNLFPDDPGLDLPHQSAKLWSGDGRIFDEKRCSRPYKWAQHLGGIDFLPEVSPLLMSVYRQQNRVQTVLQRIRARRKAQMALAEQIESLTKLKWPSLSCKRVAWFSHARVCSLQSWIEIDASKSSEPVREDGELPSSGIEITTKPTFSKHHHDEDVVDLLVSDSDVDEPETDDVDNKQSIDNSWVACGVRQYHLILTRKLKNGLMKLNAKITVGMEYPLRPPLFSLNLFTETEEEAKEWFSELRAMEAEVNIQVSNMIPWEEENQVLGHQVCCLAMLFDFYMEDADKGRVVARGRDHRKIISNA